MAPIDSPQPKQDEASSAMTQNTMQTLPSVHIHLSPTDPTQKKASTKVTQDIPTQALKGFLNLPPELWRGVMLHLIDWTELDHLTAVFTTRPQRPQIGREYYECRSRYSRSMSSWHVTLLDLEVRDPRDQRRVRSFWFKEVCHVHKRWSDRMDESIDAVAGVRGITLYRSLGY
ncbi:hypothetical protein EG327_006353 [Venturia inaequalis]|uniref:Uncharacterized protein n=2 Tax=Venturia inaequalis TaxID=5025 RepID=A0A8H3V2W7_VENIN|nr:hypothetical protein EG327_006353 [Venturia inaequalis]